MIYMEGIRTFCSIQMVALYFHCLLVHKLKQKIIRKIDLVQVYHLLIKEKLLVSFYYIKAYLMLTNMFRKLS